MANKNKNKRFLGLLIITLIILGTMFIIHLSSPEVKFLKFKPSTSLDLKSYKMYVEPIDIEITYDSPSYDLGKLTMVNLTTMLRNGTYKIGISVIDLDNNESFMTIVEEQVNINFY